MDRQGLRCFLLTGMFLILAAMVVRAARGESNFSENYRLEGRVVSGGGQVGSSDNHRLYSVLLQSGEEATPSSINFRIYGGIWYLLFPGGSSCSATRDLPAYYGPSFSFTVAIAAAPGGTVSVYAVEDVPPTGWTVGAVNEGGQWDDVNKKVKWGPFFDHNARTLTYQVTPPSGETGTKTFAGVISCDGSNVPIGGDQSIELGSYHPADTNHDYRISIGEVTAYGACWKSGCTWSVPPNPVPIEYVTNAGYIWKIGETYHYDPINTPPFVPGP